MFFLLSLVAWRLALASWLCLCVNASAVIFDATRTLSRRPVTCPVQSQQMRSTWRHMLAGWQVWGCVLSPHICASNFFLKSQCPQLYQLCSCSLSPTPELLLSVPLNMQLFPSPVSLSPPSSFMPSLPHASTAGGMQMKSESTAVILLSMSFIISPC